jgi:hypothetical protein
MTGRTYDERHLLRVRTNQSLKRRSQDDFDVHAKDSENVSGANGAMYP